MVTVLNTSIITNFGTFLYVPKSLDEIKLIIKEEEVQSAIGHQATAQILTELLEIPVEMNRIEYVQNTGDVAIVFKLRTRVAEGKILTREEIEEIGYDFGLLTKIN